MSYFKKEKQRFVSKVSKYWKREEKKKGKYSQTKALPAAENGWLF